MSKSIVILLLCFLVAVYAPDPVEQDSKTDAKKPSVKDLPSVELLAKIKREEVLPLIAFTKTAASKDQSEYQKPEKLLEYKLTDDGNISSGTKFEAREPGDQILFCPKENSPDKCLVRQTFAGSAPLRCASEPTPQWEEMPDKCGGLDGKAFEIVYKICADDSIDSEDNKLKQHPKHVTFHKICYDTELHRTLYTYHEVSPSELLGLNLLAHERSMDYPIVISDEYPSFSDHSISKDVLAQGMTSLKNPSYKLQEMVPSEDMAFATWRKTTFNNLVYEWQHEKLINVWNEIGRNIRSVMKNNFTFIKPQLFVSTAIVDASYPLPDDKQLPNIWVKMVTVYNADFEENPAAYGAAILMNNFIDHSKSPEVRNEPLEEYCDEDLCIKELTEKINEMGSAIRCCPITSDILSIFDIKIRIEGIKELPISNVTIPDQETLKDAVIPQKAGKL